MDRTKKTETAGCHSMHVVADIDALFFLVKAFHVHGEHSCVSHNEQGHSRHDSPENCTICLFTLSPFIEAGIFIYDYIPTGRPVRYLISGETDVIVTLFPAFPPCTPCVFVITPFEGIRMPSL